TDLGRHGVLVSPDDVVVTFGAGDALTMSARLFGRRDDPVLTEAPAYFSSVLNLKRMGYEVLGFKLGAEGPDWEDLSATLRYTQMACPDAPFRRPRFVTVNPDHQNPTGLYPNGLSRCAVPPPALRHGKPRPPKPDRLTLVDARTPPLCPLDRRIGNAGHRRRRIPRLDL
ncbi:MAG: hypothetical protein MUF38_16880, partial [Anaerolineae bacterium]|nr:hypothetical protein [Anaerolineae bacterium]